MRRDDFYKAAHEKLVNKSSLRAMLREAQRFEDAVSTCVFDPRFNSVNWMFDCFQVVKEIAYSFCWMSAYATEVSKLHADHEFHIQYYADNCITRITSFRDKAALLVWARYCPFNPNNRDEVLAYDRVLERLRHPVRFGLAIKHQQLFIAQLERLQGHHFDRMRRYRHLKVHRIEPKILLRCPKPSDGLRYIVPLTEKDIDGFKKKLKEMYPDKRMRARIESGCYIKGVPYDRIHIGDEYWDYAEVEDAVCECTHTCIDVARSLSMILRRRTPLKRS